MGTAELNPTSAVFGAGPAEQTAGRSAGWTADRALLMALGLLSLAAAGTHFGPDPDLWGHLRYGLDHLEQGALPRVDPYNYTAPQRTWINHEWLCEWILAAAWSLWGITGVWAVSIALVAVVLGIVLQLAYESTRGFWSVALIYAAAWYSMSIGFSFRPQLFSFACFAVSLLLIDRIYRRRRWPPAWALLFVPLLCVWANLHGGFLIGVALLGYLSAWELWRALRSRTDLRRAGFTVLMTVLALLATLLNPYGLGLWRWLFGALGVSRAGIITEWGGVLAHAVQTDLLGYYLLVLLGVILALRGRCREDGFSWILLLATAAAGWVQVRHTVIFCMVAAVYLPRHLEAALPLTARPSSFHPLVRRLAVTGMVLAAVGLHFREANRPDQLRVPLSEQPYHAFQFIHDRDLHGHLVVDFAWAQASIWHLHQRCKVAFDGRFRTVYPAAVERDYVHFARGTERWDDLLDDYPSDIVLMPQDWIGVPLLEQRPDWRCVYRSAVAGASDTDPQDERAVIFIRRAAFPQLEHAEVAGRPPDSERYVLFP